jgi:hypothetical protein
MSAGYVAEAWPQPPFRAQQHAKEEEDCIKALVKIDESRKESCLVNPPITVVT